MPNGKVGTGLRKPYVALYSNNGTTVTHTSGRPLGRITAFSADIETGEDNEFHADDVVAEVAPQRFRSGTLSITIDGLLKETAQLILGLATPDQDGTLHYGDSTTPPYMTFGVMRRYVSGGVESFTGIVFTKIRFASPNEEGATQEEEIDWQTQALEATILRDDTAGHDWKLTNDFDTEAEAEAWIKSKLDITP